MLKVGNLVVHQNRVEFGLGKVVGVDGPYVRIYFQGVDKALPEDRVLQFKLPVDFLALASRQSDPELDHLPPYRDNRFVREAAAPLLTEAKRRFALAFSGGFNDPAYLDPLHGERGYKVSAHERFLSAIAPRVEQLLADDDATAIHKALKYVYAGDGHGGAEALNLLDWHGEYPAFFDALTQQHWARQYLAHTMSFLANPDTTTFGRYADTIAEMPSRKESSLVGKWPTLTWLPFIAQPAQHIIVKPSIQSLFASTVLSDAQYRPEANYVTYQAAQRVAQVLMSKVIDSELNLSRRSLDMIDMQSFMWVVQKYHEPALVTKS